MEEKPILDPPYKELLKVSEGWDSGTFHSGEEFADIMMVEYKSSVYYANVNAAAKELAATGKRIRCVRGKGYYVLLPSEYPDAAYFDTRKAGRALKRGLDNIHSAPVQKMEHATQKKVEAIATHMARTYVTLVTAATEVKEIAGIERKQKMLQKASNGKVN